jgi:methionyl-tRNA synthetase
LPAPGELTAADTLVVELLTKTVAKADKDIRDFDFQSGIIAVKEFVDAVNLYVTEQQPWVVAKDDSQTERLHTILYVICDALRAISTLYSSLMPKAMDALWRDIGAVESGLTQSLTTAGIWGQLEPGVVITKSESLFPRIEEPESI